MDRLGATEADLSGRYATDKVVSTSVLADMAGVEEANLRTPFKLNQGLWVAVFDERTGKRKHWQLYALEWDHTLL